MAIGTARPVLVVDDDQAIRTAVSWALSDAGYWVTTAEHGRAALVQVADAPPALVLLDMRMPVMDGWTFARHYRALVTDHAPIVVMTAAYDARDRAAQIEANGHLAKPFDSTELLNTVRHHLPHEDLNADA